MKSIVLTHTHRQLQHLWLTAVVEGLVAADLTGRGFFITCGTDFVTQHSEDNLSVELWRSATKPELGDAVQIHGILINRAEGAMNDVRPHIVIQYIAERVRRFVEEITPILLSNGQHDTHPAPKKVDDVSRSFEDVVRPVIKYLNDNYHPHAEVIISTTDGRLVEGVQSTGQIMDYIKD